LEFVDPGVGRGYTVPTGTSQTLPLPWNNIDTIIYQFAEDVTGPGGSALALSAFGLFGTSVADYLAADPGTTFSYNNATFEAVITFSSPIANDSMFVTADASQIYDLGGNPFDGNWTDNVSLVSGDGTPGGDFVYNMNVLPGDVVQDELGGNYFVLSNDLIDVVGRQFEHVFLGTPTANYRALSDVNGSAFILNDDLLFVLNHQFDRLATTPAPPVLPGIRSITDSDVEDQLSTVDEGEASADRLADAPTDAATATDALFAAGVHVAADDPDSLDLLSDKEEDHWASAIDDFFGED
ncbi:MAG: hypothetical protein KC481_21435, partial [Acidimicrobiaceae bacterium]|nr:hypothetical protein [Acidimicrobiaceae bacterium]